MPRRSPIPTPLSRWWQETRTHYFPRLVVALCVLVIVVLWRGLTVTPVPRAQIVVSTVPGVVSKVRVSPHQPVHSGDPVAEIVTGSQGSGTPGEPLTLAATSDGIVSTVYRRAGESVQAGDPIIAIAPAQWPSVDPLPAKKQVMAEVHR